MKTSLHDDDSRRLAARDGRIMLNAFFPRPAALFSLPDELICSRADFAADYGYATSYDAGSRLCFYPNNAAFARLRYCLEIVVQRCVSVFNRYAIGGYSDDPDDYVHAAMRIAVTVRLSMRPHTAFNMMRHIGDWQRAAGMGHADTIVVALLAYMLLVRSDWHSSVGPFAEQMIGWVRADLGRGLHDYDDELLDLADLVDRIVREESAGTVTLVPTPARAATLSEAAVGRILGSAAPADLRFLANLFGSEEEQLDFLERIRRAVAAQPDGTGTDGIQAAPAEEWLRELDRVGQLCRSHLLTPDTLTPVEVGGDEGTVEADGEESAADGAAPACARDDAAADGLCCGLDQGTLWVKQAIEATRDDPHLRRRFRQVHIGYIYKYVEECGRDGGAAGRRAMPRMPHYKNCKEFVKMMRRAGLAQCPSDDSVQRGYNRICGTHPDWRPFRPDGIGQDELNMAVSVASVFANAYRRLAGE